MAECWKCGRQAMTFTCRYCGNKFCTEHRLPENHDCEGLEDAKEVDEKWFRDKEAEKKSGSKSVDTSQVRKPSLPRDILFALKSNYTIMIIGLTAVSFLLQFVLPGYLSALALDPSLDVIASKPWTVLTVMLVHGGSFHIFANMVTFYFFGTPVEKLVGGKKLLQFYIGSGLFASIAFVAFRNLLFQLHGPTIGGVPTLGLAVGASGAVVAVFSAVAMMYPDAEVLLYFFIPMKIRTALHLFAGIEAINLLAKLGGTTLPLIGGFASSAHLAGLIAGVWFGKRLREKHRPKANVIELLG